MSVLFLECLFPGLHRQKDHQSKDSIYFTDKGLLSYEGKTPKDKSEKERVGYWIDRIRDSTRFWLVWTSPRKSDLDIRQGDSLEFVLTDGQSVALYASRHVDLVTNSSFSFVNAPYLINKYQAMFLQGGDLVTIRIHHQSGIVEYSVRKEQASSIRKSISLFTFN